MQRSTVELLAEVNRDFYRRHAEAFDASRRDPWPGWRNVLRLARAGSTAADALGPAGKDAKASVLDLGCGNGRLLAALAACWAEPVDYLGLDASLALLARAGLRAGPPAGSRVRFAVWDLVGRGLTGCGGAACFDLVACFGFLHHVPSFAIRQAFLESAWARVRPGGMLALSFWQFGDHDRFRRRLAFWDELGPAVRLAEEAGRLAAEDLEPGDHLLRWGDGEAVRYCHFADRTEVRRLTRLPGVEREFAFLEDGRTRDLNLYVLLERGSVPGR